MATADEEVKAELLRVDALVAAGADPFAAFSRFLPVELLEGNGGPSTMARAACGPDCLHLLSACLDQYGMDVNEVLSDGQTLLTVASAYSSSNCVALLLSRGANANKLGGSARCMLASPLYFAAAHGSVAICRQLLDAGASLDFRCSTDMHRTPLHVAAAHENVGVVALMLNRGADARATDDALSTPIMCGIKSHIVVKALLPHSDLTRLGSGGESLLHATALFGGVAVLKLVLPRYVEAGLVDLPSGPVAGKPGPFAKTPLMFAVKGGKYDEAKALLRAGASRSIMDSNGSSALHSCIGGTSAACLELLLGDAPQWYYTPSERAESKWLQCASSCCPWRQC